MKTNRIIFKTNPTFRKFVAIHEDKVNINNTIDAVCKCITHPKPEQQIHRYKVRANEGARRRRLKSPTTEFKSLFNQDSFNNMSP